MGKGGSQALVGLDASAIRREARCAIRLIPTARRSSVAPNRPILIAPEAAVGAPESVVGGQLPGLDAL